MRVTPLEELSPDLKARFGPAIEKMKAERFSDDPPPSDVDTEDGAFDPAEDLDGEDLGECRRYPMPKKKHAYIFALSGDELAMVARWGTSIPAKMTEQERRIHGLALQVLVCLRRTATRSESNRCWDVRDPRFDHAAQRLKVLGMFTAETINEIVTISARLGKRREYIPPFCSLILQAIQQLCGRWLSASESLADFPQDLREQTRAFASECGAATLLDGLASTVSDDEEYVPWLSSRKSSPHGSN